MNENNKDILIKCFHAIEATSLNHTDNENVIKNFVDKINDLNQFHHISGICVYPNMVKIVKENIDSSIKIVAVAGGFPSSQTFLDIKMKEVELCIENGANEIDIVLSVGKYINQEYEFVKNEIQQIKKICKNITLKVIIESGTLQNEKDIYNASMLAMQAGADFIKTSTGKTSPAATPAAAKIMCKAIKDFYEQTNKMIGFKAAGGIVNKEDALCYFSIVNEILGEKWIKNGLFRIGASRLIDNLWNEIKC
jgi:deoxyribose-phosphate aldolase